MSRPWSRWPWPSRSPTPRRPWKARLPHRASKLLRLPRRRLSLPGRRARTALPPNQKAPKQQTRRRMGHRPPGAPALAGPRVGPAAAGPETARRGDGERRGTGRSSFPFLPLPTLPVSPSPVLGRVDSHTGAERGALSCLTPIELPWWHFHAERVLARNEITAER